MSLTDAAVFDVTLSDVVCGVDNDVRVTRVDGVSITLVGFTSDNFVGWRGVA